MSQEFGLSKARLRTEHNVKFQHNVTQFAVIKSWRSAGEVPYGRKELKCDL